MLAYCLWFHSSPYPKWHINGSAVFIGFTVVPKGQRDQRKPLNIGNNRPHLMLGPKYEEIIQRTTSP